MKALTGGDTIVATAKYEGSVEFRPSCTLILCANDAPVLRDDDAGMWACIRRIPLTAQIPAEQQDRELKFKLQRPEHAAAILAWAVAGCLAWQRDGLGACAAVEKSTAAYRNEMEVVELKSGYEAHNTPRHALGNLNERFGLANLAPRQCIQAPADALQLAGIGEPQHRGLGHASLGKLSQP